jgi:hypothetical protein
MKKVTMDEFLTLFDETVHETIKQRFSIQNVTGIVCFETQALELIAAGRARRTAVIVGPTCTFKSVDDCQGKWLGDLPSERLYPSVYVEKGTVS